MALPLAATLAPFIGFIVGKFAIRLVYRVLASLGIGIITYTGTSQFIQSYSSQISSQFSSLPPQAAQVFGILNIDVFMSLIISAFAVRITLQLSSRFIGLR